MKQNWKRTLQGTLLGAVLLAMAGCGSTNVMDTYSFGHQVIRVGQSEITIALPYEMGKSTKNMTDDGYPIDIYGSVTEHMVIEVEALRAGDNKPLPTVDEFLNRSKSEFTKMGATIKETKTELHNGMGKRNGTGNQRTKPIPILNMVGLVPKQTMPFASMPKRPRHLDYLMYT